METDGTEEALLSLEKTLKNFHEAASKTSVDDNEDVKNTGGKQKSEKASETVDTNEGEVQEDNIDNSTKDSLDLEKNPREAFNQFKVKPATDSGNEECTTAVSGQKKSTAEEIAKNWQELGIQRCPNCKFRTDKDELFKNHCTTCPAVKAKGMIKLTYNNGEFSCNVCDDTWKNKAEFEEHIVCHLQDSPYVCLTCQNKKFTSRQQIEIHTKTEHPNGDSRCGLKGMKNGRKYTEELIHSGTITVQGKLSIPKTPRNHIGQINTSKEKTSNQNPDGETKASPVVISPSARSDNSQNNSLPPTIVTALQPHVIALKSAGGGTIHYKPEVLNLNSSAHIVIGTPSPTSSTAVSVPRVTPTNTIASSTSSLQVSSVSQPVIDIHITDSAIPGTCIESDKERAMPPARTLNSIITDISEPHTYTSKGGTLVRVSPSEDAKSKHLDSLFGELNRTTNVMQPTTVSQKIKDIANPAHDISKKEVSKPIPYNLKTITEYTCTQAVKTVTPSTSSMTSQSLFLVPVCPPMMQTQTPVAIPNTGIIYQTPKHGPVLLPLNPVSQVTSKGTGANTRGQLTTVVSTVAQKMQVVSQIQPNPVILTTGTAQLNICSNNNMNVAGNHQFTTRPLGSVKSGSVPSTILPYIQPKPRPTYKEAVDKRIISTVLKMPEVIEDGQQVPKKYLFKVKPGQGFVCEFCKKFTRDEYVFRRHVWEHFHADPLACRTCSTNAITHKIILECKLVNNIVCNLIKRAAKEHQEDISKPPKRLKIDDDDEVIDITDDDGGKDENKHQHKQDHATEVIVLDDEDENGDIQGLKIQISATFSLSDVQNLEQMSKKDTHQNSGEREDEGQNKEKENDQLDGKGKTPQSSSNVHKNITSDAENSQQVSRDAKNVDILTGQKHLKKYFFEKKTQVPGNDATEFLKGLPACDESEDDEDGKAKRNLLDKSLSEPEKDSEEVVSLALESDLKVYDPSNKAVEQTPREEINMDVDNAGSNHLISKDADLLMSNAKSQQKDAQGINADTNIENFNTPGKNIFDKEILSKQSHNAFYVCGYENCSFTCTSSSKYREHIQSKEHGNEYNYVCGHCGQKDYTEDTHVRHIFTHANSRTFLLYKCPVRLCKYKTNLLHLYAEHLRAHPTEELTVKCVYCHKTFPTIDSLVQHLKQNLLKFVICPYCSFKFVNRYVVMVHIKHFHPDKIRMVSVTSQVVCNEREINFYVPPKSKAIIYSDISAKDIPDADNLDIPALLDDFQKEKANIDKNVQENSLTEKGSENGDTDDVLSLPEEDQSDFKETEKLLKGRKDSQLETISERQIKSKGKSDIITRVGPKSLECPKCSYLSYNLALHAKHLSLHDTEPEREKRFVCNRCPKGSENLPHFKTHVGNHVGKHVIKVFSCTTCAYSSNQKCHIMDHVRDAHSEETLYTLKEEVIESKHPACRYCAFKARTPEQVFAHETAVHRIDPKVSLSKNVESVSQEKEYGNEKSKNLQTSAEAENEPTTSSTNSEKSIKKKKYKYHCEYCSDFFKHKSNLKEHMINDHIDTENKQFIFFKCKYCIYTSTMKEMIIGHLGEEHPGMDLRILRKIEVIESLHMDTSKSYGKEAEKYTKSVNVEIDGKDIDANATSESNKEEIVIPDGNVFKQTFSCPKCPFTSNMRIKTMKHLKEHPELKPIRPDQQKSPSKKTARKSSSSNFSKVDSKNKKSSLFQQIPKSSEPLKNPFIAVKESLVTKDVPSLDAHMAINSPSKDPYTLGEQKLHTALSACFIPLEKDMKYQCRICKQKIFKKFVLHRHILDHLKVVFFKCRYCVEGSIERTLMTGHIQKDHSLRPVLYDSVEKSVLDQQFKERIFNQDFNDTVDIFAASETLGSNVEEVKTSGIVKKAVHEIQTIDDDSEEEVNGTGKPLMESDETDKENSLKCPKCRYIARYKYNLNLHLDSHKDPMKIFTCSVCDYRGDKYSVISHVYRVFHLSQAKVLENGQPLYHNLKAQKLKDSTQIEKSKNEVSKNEERQSSVESDRSQTSVHGKQIKLEALTISKSGDIFEMRTAYKCRECGEKRDSKSAMYHHFKTSKCNKAVVKCSLCSFQNTVKAAIHRHAVKRHPGKKVTLLNLPLSSKFMTLKFPIRYPKSIMKDLRIDNSEEERNTSPKLDVLPEEKSKIQESDLLDNGQIRCQICAKYVCESVMKLQFHVNTTHQGAMLQCQKCSYKSPLVKHMINHCKNLHFQRVALYGSKAGSSDKTKTAVKPGKVSKTILVGGSDEKIVFKCPKCSLELKTLQTVQMHLYVHFNYKPYSCKYCGKHMSRTEHIVKHTKKIHGGKPVKYDRNVDEAIESKVKKIYESVKKSVVKQRIMLGRNRPSYLDQMEHVEDGVRRKEKIFYCDFCRYKNDRRGAVRNHVASVHAGISKKRPLEIDSDTESPVNKVLKKETTEDFNEKDDTKQYDDSSPLKYKVIKSPSGTKKFKCSGCDYMNEKIKNLKLHVWRNHSSSPQGRKEAAFRCYFCHYSSIHSSSDIHKHFKCHHPTKNIKYINKSGRIVARDKPGDKDANRDSKSSPARSTSSSSPARSATDSEACGLSPMKPVEQRSGVTNYNCEVCGYSREGLFHFRLHLISHKQFTQITSELDDESRMSCGFCTYLGKNTFDLSSHIASHMAEMRYKCPYCDYASYERCKVTLHVKHLHSDREEIVVDREFKKACNGTIRLVNLYPVVELSKVKYRTRKKKYRRIMIETDESSGGSFSDSEDDDSNSAKGTEMGTTDTTVSNASTGEPVLSQENDGNGNSLAENREKIIEDSGDVFSESESLISDENRGNGNSLAENGEKIIEDSGDVFSESESLISDENRGECQSFNRNNERHNQYSDEKDTETTVLNRIFRIESQPFSPSDLINSEDNELNESTNIQTCLQNEDNEEEVSVHCSAKVKFSIDENEDEKGNSFEAQEILPVNQRSELKNKAVEQSADKSREIKQMEISGHQQSELKNQVIEQNEMPVDQQSELKNEIIEQTVDKSGERKQKETPVKQDEEQEKIIEQIVDKSWEIEQNETLVNKNQEQGVNVKKNEQIVNNSEESKQNETSVKQKQELENKMIEKTVHKSVEDEQNESNCLRADDLLESSVENCETEDCTNDSVVKDNAMVKVHVTEATSFDESVEHKRTEASDSGNNNSFPICKDISMENTETFKYCNNDSLMYNKDTVRKLSSSNFMTYETENECSSTYSYVNHEPDARQNKSLKTPRNVFETISDVKDSVFEDSEPHESDGITIPHCAVNREHPRNNMNDDENLNANVFEKFTSDIKQREAFKWCEGQDNDENCEEGQDNIFEKLTSDCINKTATFDNELESYPANEEDIDKNIFEKFGCVDSENIKEDPLFERKADDAYKYNIDLLSNISCKDIEDKCKDKNDDNESNIFSKFSSENLELAGSVEIDCGQDQNMSDVDEINIFKKFSDNILREEEKENESKTDKDSNKNLFEKFAVGNLVCKSSDNKEFGSTEISLLPGKDSNVKISKIEKKVEDMEVDELIQSIEETVNESVTNREKNYEMETD